MGWRRSLPCNTLLALSALLFLLSPPIVLQAQVGAQDRDAPLEGYAILQRQPRLLQGLPLLRANTLAYVQADYDLEGTIIEVYLVPLAGVTLTDGAIPDGRVWERTACTPVALEYVADQHLPVWRVRRQRYHLYITIPLLEGDPGGSVSVCGFAAPFVELFEFFLARNPRRIETLRPLPEFPAVLEPVL